MNPAGSGGELKAADDDFVGSALLEALHEIAPDDPKRHLPTRLVVDGPPVPVWSPPTRSFDLEMEQFLGSPALQLLPDETEQGTRLIDQRIRRLPARLRKPIQSVRTSWHREDLLELVEVEAEAHALPSQFRELEVPGQPFTQYYLPEIHRRRAVERLAADAAFLERLRSAVTTKIEQGHRQRLFAGWPRPLPILAQCPLPATGPWNAESWLGLALSAMPEAAPEEVLVALAQRTWRRLGRDPVRRGQASGRVLNWGALHSIFAMALMATAPTDRELDVHEVDTVGQPQGLPWVPARTRSLVNPGPYDLAFVHIPPPGEDANHLRNRYKEVPEVHVEDVGRLAPRKWRRRTRKLLGDVIRRVKPDGEIGVLVPTSVRIVDRDEPYPEWGYAARPDLADGIADALLEAGWHVSHDIEVREINPLAQPFFGLRRCTWRFMLATANTLDPNRSRDPVEDVGLP